jgi:nucleoid-associated protein YgaU
MPEPIALRHAGGKGAAKSADQQKRASLDMFNSVPAPGGAKIGSKRGSISFQFNPKELTIAKAAKWERKPASGAKQAGPPEFKGADPCKLTLEMFFDASDTHNGSVVASIELLFSCCIPTPETRSKKKPSPPLVVFKWGQINSFPSFITSVSAKYTLFAADGTPIRATCSVSLEEMPGGPFPQNPTSGSLAARRVHRSVSGDTLASLAFDEYGDAAMWRLLADFNDIDDPLRIPSGTVLLLPAPEELLTTGR